MRHTFRFNIKNGMCEHMFDPEIREVIARKAYENDMDPAALLAVISVESGGRIFTKVNGLLEPIIRFEGHYFYRLLPKAKRNIAVTRGMAHRRAGGIKNSRFQRFRWEFLNNCIKLDRDAALQSTSWGVGQVMGSHWRWLGYASVDAMIFDVRKGIAGQCELMVRFIKKAKLVRFMEDQDWAGFARSYNGPGYKKNKYDLKMARAYKHFARLENANIFANGSDANSASDIVSNSVSRIDSARKRSVVKLLPKKIHRNAIAVLRLGNVGENVSALQMDLRSCGYLLSVDGDFGPITCRAVIAFQKTHELVADGIVGPRTYEVIGRFLPQPANLLRI